MLESVKLTIPECIDVLRKNVVLDAGFKTFYEWCVGQGIPVIVVSSGLKQIIRALLVEYLGPSAEDIEIISNHADIHEDGTWDIVFIDERYDR